MLRTRNVHDQFVEVYLNTFFAGFTIGVNEVSHTLVLPNVSSIEVVEVGMLATKWTSVDLETYPDVREVTTTISYSGTKGSSIVSARWPTAYDLTAVGQARSYRLAEPYRISLQPLGDSEQSEAGIRIHPAAAAGSFNDEDFFCWVGIRIWQYEDE
jgi:hypothetical protein